jgi:hypothetical protein
VSYDDETLMAYADGELDAARRAEIDAAVAQDPALAARVAAHRALRAEVAGAFATVLSQPLPERLRSAAAGEAASAERPRGNVVQFPARGARAPGAPWRAREWLAMAASLVLGVVVTWRFVAPTAPLIGASNGALVARGALATALDQQLASEQPRDSAVLIGLTFKTRDGGYCRNFTLRDGGTAGLACRARDEWRIPVTAAADVRNGDVSQAAANIPPAVMQAIEARISGEALDAAGEAGAKNGGWIAR